MPACRFPPCFHQKSRRVNPTIPSAAFSMQIKYMRISPHVPRTFPLFSSVFHGARTLSGSLRSPPSPRGEGGTAPAVDRVLSLTAHLRRIFHLFQLSFIPPVPYPPLRGTFPSRGRLTIRGKPAVKRPSGIAHLYSAALRSFDSVLPFQISHFFSAQDDEMRRTTTLNLEP